MSNILSEIPVFVRGEGDPVQGGLRIFAHGPDGGLGSGSSRGTFHEAHFAVLVLVWQNGKGSVRHPIMRPPQTEVE